MPESRTESNHITAAPASRPPRRRLRALLSMLLLLIVLGIGWFWLGQPAVRKRQLLTACASADRIILAYRTPPERLGPDEWTRGERVAHEIAGRDKVLDFLALIELRASIPGLHCQCSGSPYIELSDGGNVLAGLTIQHEEKLRWVGGRWFGDARLTPRSQEALPAWIEVEGGSALANLEAELEMLWDEYHAARELEIRTHEALTTGPAATPSSTME